MLDALVYAQHFQQVAPVYTTSSYENIYITVRHVDLPVRAFGLTTDAGPCHRVVLSCAQFRDTSSPVSTRRSVSGPSSAHAWSFRRSEVTLKPYPSALLNICAQCRPRRANMWVNEQYPATSANERCTRDSGTVQAYSNRE